MATSCAFARSHKFSNCTFCDARTDARRIALVVTARHNGTRSMLRLPAVRRDRVPHSVPKHLRCGSHGVLLEGSPACQASPSLSPERKWTRRRVCNRTPAAPSPAEATATKRQRRKRREPAPEYRSPSQASVRLCRDAEQLRTLSAMSHHSDADTVRARVAAAAGMTRTHMHRSQLG